MAGPSNGYESSVSDYWSADHSSSTPGSGSFQTWSSVAAVKPTDQPELGLLTSETLSMSDEDCISSATPTFSDKSEAPQAEGARETAKIEDIAKQLDFGSVTVLARLSNQQESQHQADAAAAYGRAYTEDLECIRPTSKDAAAPSQSQLTLYCEESDRDSDSGSSSSSHQVLQSTAASARPSCRRRAALDSDSDSEQVCTQRQEGLAQLPAQGPSTGVYTFDVSDSDHASDQDTPRASPRLPLEALPSRAAACQRENSVSDCSVIVLDSSEEEEHGASCHRYNYLLCSSDSDEELSASHKENLSPTQLATRLQSLHIRPPRTSVKPLQPPSKGVHWPKAPQSLPPKAKHTQLPPSSPSISKAQSLARFKREREGLAYQLFQELNSAVFGGRLPADLRISWNVHLKTTAGLTHYSKTSLVGQAPRYCARVELSTKVIDSTDKLQRTLCHELCHVATWLLDHVGKPPHGPHFKAWAAAAMRVHPHLDITTCHQYDIHFAWRWQCTNPECLQMYKRHSKSINTTKQVCSSCRGQLQSLGRFNQDGTPAKARAPSQYSLFVKENFASHKKSCKPGTPHKEIMQALSCSWRARASASDLAEVADAAKYSETYSA